MPHESLLISLFIIISYLLGSISGSIFLGKFKGIDVRKVGSGNAGATNALRTGGKTFAFFVFFIDVAKGLIIILILKFIKLDYHPLDIEEFQIYAGIAAVIGHVYPIFYGFKGGKGAATLIAVITLLYPETFLILLLSWLLIIIFTGYVGLATIVSGFIFMCISLLDTTNWIVWDHQAKFSIFVFLFLAFTHKDNINRMFKGEENQFKKIMIFKKIK